MATLSELSVSDLEKKIKSAKVAVERNEGLIKEAAEKKLKALEAELKSRGNEVEKEVKKEVKEGKKEAKKAEKTVEKEVEAVEKDVKKAVDKPAAKPKKKKPKYYPSPAEKFTLTVDGTEYAFKDLKSKEECQKAIDAVKGRYSEVKKHKAATKAGIERGKTVSVTKRMTDNFAMIAKKAVSEVSKTKIDTKPSEIKKDLDAVEKAFNNLFNTLESLMDKKIPDTQRKQIMDILTKFEDKVEKGSDKKEKAAAKPRAKKEDGGIVDVPVDDSWSYASLM